MIFFYNLTFILLLIVFLPLILIVVIINKKWREDILERFCIYDNKISFKDKKIIWFHAASVGEIQALLPVLKEIKKICNDYDFVITTTSINGKKKIKKEIHNLVLFYSFIPLDIYFFTDYFIKKINPEMVVFVETEFWPNLVNNIYNNKIPLLLMNGRISDRSHSLYKIFSFVFSSMLKKFSLIIVQSEKMAKRFISISGLNERKIIILPNTKFSIDENIKAKYVITQQNNKKIIIAGSIREGEEELIIKAFADLKDKSILIIAPRYLQRVDKIKNIIKNHDLKYELWTNLKECNKILDYEIVILNTIGELTNFYSIGDIAIVGGGFKNFGGHNLIEPASFGLPVITGKNMYNFEDTTDKLEGEGGTIKIETDVIKLSSALKDLIENEEERKLKGEKNKKIIENFRSSADTTALLIKEFLIDKRLNLEQI